MESPVTLRLNKETRERLIQAAKHHRLSTSELIRQAIDSWISANEARITPYEAASGLIGAVHGGNPKRSVQTGRRFKRLLKRKRR